MKRKRLLPAIALAGLAGCGRVADLQPPPGHALPVKPLMARATPAAKDLLTPPTYAKPDRVDELITRSQQRQEDPFDLPPPTGGAAPSEPAGSQPQPTSTDTKVSTPGE